MAANADDLLTRHRVSARQPCVGSEEDPTFGGEIKHWANANGNQSRAGFSGAGTVYDADSGAPYFYSSKVDIWFDSGKIGAQQYQLLPIAKWAQLRSNNAAHNGTSRAPHPPISPASGRRKLMLTPARPR
jgi:hypothetical protein